MIECGNNNNIYYLYRYFSLIMDEPNYDEVKVILRSILTSFPGTLNISQVLEDYEKLEGHPLPYKQLGFNTVYELLKSMNDIIKVSGFKKYW